MLFNDGEKLKQHEKIRGIEKQISEKTALMKQLVESHENMKRGLSILQIEHVVETRILERMNGASDVDEAEVGSLQGAPRAE